MKGRKTQQPEEHIREEPRGKKKKKNQKQEREKNLDRLAWVAHGARGPAWLGSRAACPGLGSSLSVSVLFFFFLFFFLSGFFWV